MKKVVFYVISFLLVISQPCDCSYEALDPLLDQYKRPFTMLELGSKPGDFSFEIAKKHDSVCIVVGPGDISELFNNCCRKKLNNIVLLHHRLSVSDVHQLGECEHFDVVMVRDVQELFGEKWQGAIDELLSLGEHTFIEVPKGAAYQSMHEYMINKGGECVAQLSSDGHGLLYFFKIKKLFLSRRKWGYKSRAPEGEYRITSTFFEKRLIKSKPYLKVKDTKWHPGINLYTFKKLNGIYPQNALIRRNLVPLANHKHNDLQIFNVIIQGLDVVAIDCDQEWLKHSFSIASARAFLPRLLEHFS